LKEAERKWLAEEAVKKVAEQTLDGRMRPQFNGFDIRAEIR
jgi:hypothetical protein